MAQGYSQPACTTYRPASTPGPKTTTQDLPVAGDSVTLNPWSELEAQGWLSHASGALGGVLQPALAASLGQALERIDRAGLKLRFPTLGIGLLKTPAKSPEAALRRLCQRPAQDIKAEALLPTGEKFKVNRLEDLMALDLFYGGGQGSTAQVECEAQALKSLEDLGWTFTPKKEEPVKAVEAFARINQEPANIHFTSPEGATNLFGRRQDAVALDYLHGSQEWRGGLDREFADGLRETARLGFQFGRYSTLWYPDSPFEALRGPIFPYSEPQTYIRKPAAAGYVLDLQDVPMRIEPRHAARLATEGKLEKTYDDFVQAKQAYYPEHEWRKLRPVLDRTYEVHHKVGWYQFFDGLQRLEGLGFPDLPESYAKLLEGCQQPEILETRLQALASRVTDTSYNPPSLIDEVLHRLEVENLAQTGPSEGPEVKFEEDFLEVGDALLDVR